MSAKTVLHINDEIETLKSVKGNIPLSALCGFVRVPKMHDSKESFEPCARCTQMALALQSTGQAKAIWISLLTEKSTSEAGIYVSSKNISYTYTDKGL